MKGLKDWLERWPQYAHTVPDEILYEPVEREVNALLQIASEAASRTAFSYAQTLETIQRGMITASLPMVRDEDLEAVRAEVDRLRAQRRATG